MQRAEAIGIDPRRVAVALEYPCGLTEYQAEAAGPVNIAAAPSRAALRPPGLGAIRDQGGTREPAFGIAVTGPDGCSGA